MRWLTYRDSSDFNPRSSCEERQMASLSTISKTDFNPRSSCEERPELSRTLPLRPRKFQSTLLMRGATWPSAPRRWL